MLLPDDDLATEGSAGLKGSGDQDAVPCHDGFNIRNRLFQGGERIQVHAQVGNNDSVVGDAAGMRHEAQDFACDVGNTVVVPGVGKLIDKDDGRVGAGDAGEIALNARNDFSDGSRVGHGEVPPNSLVMDRMVEAVQEVLEQRLAGDLGPCWPFARFLAASVVEACLAKLPPERA